MYTRTNSSAMNETVSRIQDPSCQSEVSRRDACSRASSHVNGRDVESRDAAWWISCPGDWWVIPRKRALLFPPPRSSSIARAIARAANTNDVMTHGFGFIACLQVRSRWTNWIHVAPTGRFFSRLAISTETTQHFLLRDIDLFNWFFFKTSHWLSGVGGN